MKNVIVFVWIPSSCQLGFLRSYNCFFYFAFDHIFNSGIEVASVEMVIGLSWYPRGKVKHAPYTAYTIYTENFIGIDIAKGNKLGNTCI